ncbi:MAG: hypothetical protein WDA53_04375 [Bacillota bacterium]
MSEKQGSRSREIVGGSVSVIAGIIITVLAVVYLFSEYNIILKGFFATGRVPGVIMQSFHQPIFAQVVGVAGVMMIVGGYGFFIKKKWAWLTAFVGSTVGIFATFLLMMFPLMVLLPMKHVPTFLLCVLTWFVLATYVRPHGWKQVAFSFTCGMAMVMTFMNGNAAFNKILGAHYKMATMKPDVPHVGMIKMMTGENPALLFQSIFPIAWLGALGFFLVTIAVLYRKEWALPVGLGASIISIVAGTPVAYVDTMIDKAGEQLSMFAFAPILAVVTLVLLLVFGEKIWAPKEVPLAEKTKEVSV